METNEKWMLGGALGLAAVLGVVAARAYARAAYNRGLVDGQAGAQLNAGTTTTTTTTTTPTPSLTPTSNNAGTTPMPTQTLSVSKSPTLNLTSPAGATIATASSNFPNVATATTSAITAVSPGNAIVSVTWNTPSGISQAATIPVTVTP